MKREWGGKEQISLLLKSAQQGYLFIHFLWEYRVADIEEEDDDGNKSAKNTSIKAGGARDIHAVNVGPTTLKGIYLYLYTLVILMCCVDGV